MKRMLLLGTIVAGGLLALLAARSAWGAGADSIVNTSHNLSANGPGTIKAVSEQEVCIFCHTPHNATPVQPLWNRAMPTVMYKPYSSSSLKSQPGQPTGSSKLCLSCHDGTIALGSVNSRSQPIAMAGGMTTLPLGVPSNLGTDLSDDHPISFPYDSNLVAANPALRDPAGLPAAVTLDSTKQLQCTACHDPHKDTYGNFLVMANDSSQLCNTCHIENGSDVQNHQNCNACHQTHSAPSGALLLAGATVTDTCLLCHGSSAPPLSVLPAALRNTRLAATDSRAALAIAAKLQRVRGVNIAADLAKSSSHDTKPAISGAARRGNAPAAMGSDSSNVTCSDCHEPHTIRTVQDPGTTPLSRPGPLSGTYGKARGVMIDGGKQITATADYQICLKCHSDDNATPAFVTRVISQPNLRLQFAPGAASFHPIAAPGRNMNVPSLKSPYTTTSIINCVDCHGSDTSKKAGGSGPNGPHGSNIPPLLLARYDTQDMTNESPLAYALCYRCHERTTVLSDRSTTLHKGHVVDQRTPCSACHTAHGVPAAQGTTTHNFALINFDSSIVMPVSGSVRPDYTHTSPGHGTCTLKCHGKVHNAMRY